VQSESRIRDAGDVNALVDEGRLPEAVDLLADLVRRDHDPADEVSLIDLRAKAAANLSPGAGRTPWPPEYADPFPGVVGRIPEVPASELTSEILGGAVAHHGGLMIRGIFSDAQVGRTVELIERVHERRNDAGQVDGDGAGPAGSGWYRPMPTESPKMDTTLRAMVAEQGGTWLADSPTGAAQVLEELRVANVTPAIAGHLGERPFFSLQKSTLRRSLPVFNWVAWHQDGSFLAEDVRTMNVWVALSPCGGDHPSPGLELVPRRIPDILPIGGGMTKHAIADEIVADIAIETPTVIPEFAPGDGLMFDERFLHRTHLTHEMTEIRYALECWFFAPSHASPAYMPLLV
jgi:hypothetical protein